MTRTFPDHLAPVVPTWLAARRYGLPAAAVAEATARRAAGDWRGACAAARVDVALDPAQIRYRYGVELAGRVEDDLRHLVPDLVRWYLPRNSGGSGLFEPWEAVVLAAYPGESGELALSVHTPPKLEGPQRPVLRFGRVGELPQMRYWSEHTDRWDRARHRWDARATGMLLFQLGGGDRVPFHGRDGRRLRPEELPGADRPPVEDTVRLIEWIILAQDAGHVGDAWAAMGITTDFSGASVTLGQRLVAPVPLLLALRATGVSGDLWLIPPVWLDSGNLVVTVDGDRVHARLDRTGALEGTPIAPAAWWQRPPDLDLLRFGLIEPAGLHPLVRAAMFPDAPEDPADHRPPAPPYRPGRLTPAPVRCGDAWHRVGFRDGRIAALSHDPAEDARERMVRALGGTVSPCFAVAHAWRGTTPGRLPRALRELRRHVLYALNHGDGDEVHRLLDQGLDPTGIRDRRGRTALHLMAQVGEPALVARLVEAGLDVNAGDCYRRTPLAAAAFDGAPAAVVRALLDAGADATLTDDMEASALHVIRCLEAAMVVPWLIEAGLDVNAPDYGGRRPLLALLQLAAPPEVFRALLAAGADPRVLHEYDQTLSIAGLVRKGERTDLDFLLDAWRAAGGGAGG